MLSYNGGAQYFVFSWYGQNFNETQILDSINSDTQNVKMFVNGTENTQFENYEFKEHDKVKIVFE
ncbi:MAG: hypothetical protein COA78_09750 [Blastopirellula sp.]|nr:MAG: hypothetical protein COA78_09750 [Blastopirellula sp.]